MSDNLRERIERFQMMPHQATTEVTVGDLMLCLLNRIEALENRLPPRIEKLTIEQREGYEARIKELEETLSLRDDIYTGDRARAERAEARVRELEEANKTLHQAINIARENLRHAGIERERE